MAPDPVSIALLRSLLEGSLFVGDLPEAPCFHRSHLFLPETIPTLNLQQKLGHLYEDALSILLEGSPSLSLLEKSLQLRRDIHSTVGELDYLLRDRNSRKIIHLELATKFYLTVDSPDGLTFPGPDARDNYHRKLTRLREHQLSLSSTYQDLLPETYRSESIEAQQLIYGCLFDHIHADAQATPEFVSPNCRRGKWLHEVEVAEFFPKETSLHHIPKYLWPVPFPLLNNIPLQTWTPGESLNYCFMIRADKDPTPYFIAPNSYPLTGPAS